MPPVHQSALRVVEPFEAADPARPEARFVARAAVIDLLEVHVLDRLRDLGERACLRADLLELEARAAALRRRLEAVNERTARRLADRIGAGRYTGAGLRRAFARLATPGRSGRYDALDLLVEGVLAAGEPAEARHPREPEMVGYQPAPARAILSLIERAGVGPGDLLYDLGSGLGRVAILAALLSGARAQGVELEPAYVEYATRSARLLGLPGVQFVQGDARQASLAGGTVYFMFTPFRGAMLRQVLERLRAEARARPIRVCTLGPCTAEVAGASWLEPTGDGAGEHEVAVFRSVAPPGDGRGGPAPIAA